MPSQNITNKKFHANGVITYTIENTWFPRNIINCGWGNGYICLPKDHPRYGLDYDDIAHPPNQEWTYSQEESLPNEEGVIETYWVFGFDTAHYDQDLFNWPESRVIECIENCVSMF